MSFVPAETSTLDVAADLYVVIFRGRLLCASEQAWQPLAPDVLDHLHMPVEHRHYLGALDGQHCFAVFFRQPEQPEIPGYSWQPLRSLLGEVDEELFQLAGRALQITRWYRDHQYCGVCGQQTSESLTDRSLVCQGCGARFYPRIAPCVIGLVIRGDQCLLGRGVRHPEGLYSTLAGFVEPGESAEQAFAREVMEETSIEVTNVRYFGSQPWPFPGQLMIGFTAEYVAGEIRPKPDEIIDADWFSIDALPKIPPQSTIAGQLIRSFVSQIRNR